VREISAESNGSFRIADVGCSLPVIVAVAVDLFQFVRIYHLAIGDVASVAFNELLDFDVII
jgi:hypothetical protein